MFLTELPLWDAGIAFGYVLILAETPDERVAPFYMIHMSASDPQPKVGSRCTFHHQTSPIRQTVGGMDTAPGLQGELVERFECDPPATPPPARPFG